MGATAVLVVVEGWQPPVE